MKFQVAIIGSPGSGKTVLTAVLSRYLSGHSDKVYMNPKGAYQYQGNYVETISSNKYVSEMLDLLRKGEWPLGTPPDQKFELGFELNIRENTYEMKLLDSGGEDLQAIWLNYDRTSLSPFRQKLFEYILSSTAVILIVNLDHFEDAETLTKRDENENVLKEAVDNLVKAGECHYILVCFTAYDKYKARIDETYGGNFINYLRGELPMFYRSCEAAGKTVVRDYTEYGFGQKKVYLRCIAVAPVIALRPAPGMDSERYGKPPIGFDIKNNRHCWGLEQMADWLCMCEQSERNCSEAAETVEKQNKISELIKYRIAPIAIGMVVGFFALAHFF
jgi:GTPase SAR1 family protein